MPRDAPLRAVEFYCGIGGLHYSLQVRAAGASVPTPCADIDARRGAQRARPHDAEVVASYDVNPLANETYALNFGRRPSGRDIRSLRPDELDAHAAHLWLLSPPCQARRARCASCVICARARSVNYTCSRGCL